MYICLQLLLAFVTYLKMYYYYSTLRNTMFLLNIKKYKDILLLLSSSSEKLFPYNALAIKRNIWKYV